MYKQVSGEHLSQMSSWYSLKDKINELYDSFIVRKTNIFLHNTAHGKLSFE